MTVMLPPCTLLYTGKRNMIVLNCAGCYPSGSSRFGRVLFENVWNGCVHCLPVFFIGHYQSDNLISENPLSDNSSTNIGKVCIFWDFFNIDKLFLKNQNFNVGSKIN